MFKIGLFLLFFSSICRAVDDPGQYAGKDSMNGYKLNDFKGFEKKWNLVTVRFRRDTKEQRFTYANKVAWKALLAGGKSYPKGAVFAKIGIATQDDPSFVSSAVPAGARRYQFMVRDTSRFKSTSGWGYALFDASGKTYPGDPSQATVACAACHNLVPERQFVFSEAMVLTPVSRADHRILPTEKKHFQFETVGVQTLPPNIIKQIPASFGQIRKMTGPLIQSVFQGTLDEIRPVLYAEVLKTSIPTIFSDISGASYSLVVPVPENEKCTKNELGMLSVLQPLNQKALIQLFCIPKLE